MRVGSPVGRFVVGSLLLVGALVAAPAAHATVSVSRAELSETRLRIEGSAIANRTITVDGVAMGTSDGSGRFRIERDPFAAPGDCTVDVNDGSAAPTSTTLSGCSVSSPSSPTPTATTTTTAPTPTATTTTTTPSLSALTVEPAEVVGGETATGTVTLTSAAGTGGFEIALSSDNTAAATVPPGVTVPAGATSATFTVTTNQVSNDQSAIIIGTAGGVTRHDIITVRTAFSAANGSVSLSRGGNGQGRVTSEPPGIDCTVTDGGTTGTCGNVFFPDGTEVKLEARPADDSSFLGWEFEVSCPDAPEVTVRASVAHICRPVFADR